MSFILLGILNSQAAGGGAVAAYDHLETQVLSSSASSVTFTGLDSYSDYKHLQIRIAAQQSFTGFPYQVTRFRINNDTNRNYAHHDLKADGGSLGTQSIGDTLYIQLPPQPGSQDGNVYGAMVVDILDFSSTTKNTTVRALGGGYFASNQRIINLSSGLHDSTSAVTSFTHYVGDPIDNINWTAGSRWSLYGIRG